MGSEKKIIGKKKNPKVKAPKIKGKKGKSPEFPLVGIGGSAGSLGAFEQFFMNMPLNKGIAFVVIQHLPSTKNSLLPELISRSTKMPVSMVREETIIKPDNIYVISPGHELVVENNKLRSLQKDKPHATKFAIDTFFKSLGIHHKEKAIGILLSGMGNDGSEGISVLKQKGGMVMVQDPKTAMYDPMPGSAIETGQVDLILPVEDMPEQLLNYVKNNYSVKVLSKKTSSEKTDTVLQKILQIINTRTGHDFSFYKTNTVLRRIERRMLLHQFTNMAQYLRFLEDNYEEAEILFHEMLIGVTNFFREPEAFNTLREKVFPQLLKKKTEGNIRVWIAACSTGEEAYSMAITLLEFLEKQKISNKYKIQLFGTDIDQEAINIARLGIYPESISRHVSPEQLKKYFVKKDAKYQIKKEIREMVVFAPQSLIKDPPFTKLDILSCRNFLIYLNADMQKRLLSLFHYALNPDGILFLGSSETISNYGDLFAPLSTKFRIFRRTECSSAFTGMINFPLAFVKGKLNIPEQKGKSMSNKIKVIPDKVQKTLLDSYAPPSVVITGSGDIVYINGDAGKYLEFAPGQAALNIIKMAREGLKFDVVKAIQEVNTNHSLSVHKDLWVKSESGYKIINLTVRPFYEKEMEGLMLVSFEETGSGDKKENSKNKKEESTSDQRNITELEQELKYTKVHLQNTIQEMEATLEEMTSNNEEIQSTNEELQSANEELTTSKEELQSLNEELVTVNAELNAKMDEYSQINNDIKNLLDSTDIATIFLDNDLNIKRFTPHAKNIFKLIPVDIGRPITDIVSTLKYQDLIKDVKKVLETLAYRRVEVETSDNDWYEMRILPYRTTDNYIGGVVITFTDISKQRKLEETIGSVKIYAEKIIDTVRDPMVILDEKLRIKSVNKAFFKKFKVKEKEVIGSYLFHIGNKQWDIPMLRKLLLEILPEKKEMEEFKVQHTFPEIGYREMLLNARKLEGYGDDLDLILLSMEDVTEKIAPKQK